MSEIRSELLKQAISRLAKLSVDEQDQAAIEILAVLCSGEEWVLVAASEPYQKWLAARRDPPIEDLSQISLASLAGQPA